MSGEGYSQPEEWASDKVKGVRAYKIGAKVGKAVPGDVAAFYCLVADLIKGYLLNIKVTVEEEIAFVLNNERRKNNTAHHQSKQKGAERPFLGGTQRYGFVIRISHIFVPQNKNTILIL